MIDREHNLPLARQSALLRLSRSTLYYEPRPVPAADLAIMRRIDALHLDYPFAGSRMLRDLLRGEAVVIGREHVATMMRRMGIEALYRRPNTSKSAPGHKIYPYLLRGLAVERANKVWAMDITYIAMARGDYDGCRILPRSGWRSTDPARPAGDFQHRPEPAPAKAGGSQFTGAAFTGLLLENAIHQHGWPRRLARQCFCRAALALGQIRGGLSAGLRQCRRGTCLTRPVSGLLQPHASAFEP